MLRVRWELVFARQLIVALVVTGAAGAVPKVKAPVRAPVKAKTVVAVLDFLDLSDHRGRFYERRAADALQLALRGRERFEMVPRAQVRRELGARGLAPPFGPGHAQLVADLVGADYVLRGVVKSCTVTAAKESATVEVTLEVQVLDGASGEQVDEVSGSAQVATKELTTILEALADAAFEQAAQQIAVKLDRVELQGKGARPKRAESRPAEPARLGPKGRRTPRLMVAPSKSAPPAEVEAAPATETHIVGAVLGRLPGKNKFIISVGGGRGVIKGMEFAVTRPGRKPGEAERIGTLKVIRVDSRDATAVALDGARRILSGDHVESIGMSPRRSPAR